MVQQGEQGEQGERGRVVVGWEAHGVAWRIMSALADGTMGADRVRELLEELRALEQFVRLGVVSDELAREIAEQMATDIELTREDNA